MSIFLKEGRNVKRYGVFRSGVGEPRALRHA